MIRLSQHVPMFVNDGDGGWTVSANSLPELFAIPEVAVYARDTEPVEWVGSVTGWLKDGTQKTVRVIHDAPDEKRFYRFSNSDGMLMAEHNHGDYWWVVGHLRADDPSELADLPKWEPSERGKQKTAEWNAGKWPKQKSYRCAEHGVDQAVCCLPRWRRDESEDGC